MKSETDDEFNRMIGVRIKELRLAKGMSQQTLAEALGYKGPSWISHMENGRRWLTPHQLYMIGKIFSVSVERLLGRTGWPK